MNRKKQIAVLLAIVSIFTIFTAYTSADQKSITNPMTTGELRLVATTGRPGTSCASTGIVSQFLQFPTWYKYLPATYDQYGVCSPQVNSLSDVWLIVAAVIEILLDLSSLIAVGFVIYGGVRYTMSQGNSDEVGKAKGTVINAVVGLVIAVSAAAIVSFIAGNIT